MGFQKVVLLIIILFYGSTSLAELNADRMNDIHYEFIKLKDGYAFSGKFFIQASDTCLIQIIYEPEHLKNLLKNRYAINIVRSDKNSYDVSYTYKKPFVEIKSTYRKTLKLSEKKVIFEMIANEQKGVFLPKVLSSHGSYEIKQENNEKDQ